MRSAKSRSGASLAAPARAPASPSPPSPPAPFLALPPFSPPARSPPSPPCRCCARTMPDEPRCVAESLPVSALLSRRERVRVLCAMAPVPVPATTNAPTPSQILVFVFMSPPGAILRDACITPRLQYRKRTGHIASAKSSAKANSLIIPKKKRHALRRVTGACDPDDVLWDVKMQIVIGNVLSAEELDTVRAALARARFADGRDTAGFAARLVKRNRQAEDDRALETVRRLVAERIRGNELFALAVRPKTLSPLLFSRYDPDMHYGSHVDDALMDGMRTDVS